MRCSLIPSVRAHGASAEVWPCDHPHRKRSWEMSQRFLLRTEIRQKVLKIQPGAPFHHHHAVLQAARSVSVWNQQAGPDPERPARLTQVESERSHSALHLVSGCEISEPTHARTHSAAQLTLLTSALSQVPLKLEASAGRNRHEWSFMNIWPSLNSSLRSLKLSSISGGTNFISSKFLTHFGWFPFGKGAFLLLPTKHPSSIASSRDSCRKTWPFCY